MHGLGNDFVIVNQKDIDANINLKKLAIAVSCRKLGIGCDQFITYLLDRDNNINMCIRNPDGSTAKACGNASRCLTRIIHDNKGIKDIIINIDGRTLQCQYINPSNIKVNMGHVSFSPPWMPNAEFNLDFARRYNLASKEIIYVDIGNPHMVLFGEFSDSDQEIIGRFLQNTTEIEDGINVNFVSIKDDIINLSVWERHTGITLACGSGACASFAASHKLGFINNNAKVRFKLGHLIMSLEGKDIIMSGAAEYVFKGEYIYDKS